MQIKKKTCFNHTLQILAYTNHVFHSSGHLVRIILAFASSTFYFAAYGVPHCELKKCPAFPSVPHTHTHAGFSRAAEIPIDEITQLAQASYSRWLYAFICGKLPSDFTLRRKGIIMPLRLSTHLGIFFNLYFTTSLSQCSQSVVSSRNNNKMNWGRKWKR